MVQSSRGNYFRPVTSAYLYVLLFCGVSLVRFPGRLLGGSAGSPGALQQSTPMSPVGSIRRAFSWELFHRTPCHVQGGEGSSLCYLINLIKLVNFWGEEITSKIIAIALQKNQARLQNSDVTDKKLFWHPLSQEKIFSVILFIFICWTKCNN